MLINANEVNEIFKDCLYKNEELIKGKPKTTPTIVHGIMMNVGFNPEGIDRNKDKIKEIINNLHPTFDEGWSFLNLCLDKNNHTWTGMHQTMEELMLLGLATDCLEYTCHKSLWSMLPGSMPYVIRKG